MSELKVKDLWKSIYLWHLISYSIVGLTLAGFCAYKQWSNGILKFYGVLVVFVAAFITPLFFGWIYGRLM